MNLPVCLTVAGLDNQAFAGVYADLKTFHELDCYGVAAVTTLTVQKVDAVLDILPVKDDFFEKQLQSIFTSWKIRAVKIGMLTEVSHINILESYLKGYNHYVVFDPVIKASSGRVFWTDAMKEEIKKLLPFISLITPNLEEAMALLDTEPAPQTLEEIKELASEFYHAYKVNVLVKGGHLSSHQIYDVFYDGNDFLILRKEKVPKDKIRGTGCVLSSAIAANVAKGLSVKEAIKQAVDYTHRQIEEALAYNHNYYFMLHGIRI